MKTQISELDHQHVRRTLEIAREASRIGEIPVGCVLVLKSGEVLESFNNVERSGDPTGHAERLVLEVAGKRFGRHALVHSTLYVNLEPCVMCAGAIVASRVGRLVYATRDDRFGACRSLYRITDDPRMKHRLVICEGVFEKESRELLRGFFEQCRLQS